MNDQEHRATARAGSNIAFIKYWGNRDAALNLPLNDSISMTLSELVTVTTVAWDPELRADEIYLDGERVLDHRAVRISRHLDRIRTDYYRMFARVSSINSFPTGTGLASSASGFAALTTAAIAAFGEGLPDERELSAWARLGSGSACRSIPGGFVRWHAGDTPESSHAETAFAADWWDLRDLSVIVSTTSKEISSRQGHKLAEVHPFMPPRQRNLVRRITALEGALASRDFETFGALVEEEALETHALMLSSTPSCLYLKPATVAILEAARRWREEGLPVYVTLDAGPNPHLLCQGKHEEHLLGRITAMNPAWTVFRNRPGPAVALVEEHLL